MLVLSNLQHWSSTHLLLFGIHSDMKKYLFLEALLQFSTLESYKFQNFCHLWYSFLVSRGNSFQSKLCSVLGLSLDNSYQSESNRTSSTTSSKKIKACRTSRVFTRVQRGGKSANNFLTQISGGFAFLKNECFNNFSAVGLFVWSFTRHNATISLKDWAHLNIF